MADLLDAQDWLDIRSAITDVTDTFFDLPVVIKMRNAQNKLTAFNEKRDAVTPPTSYSFFGLNVPRHTIGDKAQAKQEQKGFMEDAEGYVLIHYPDFKNNVPPFIDTNGLCIIKPNRDTLNVLNEDLTIIGVNLVGPTETDYQLVKIHYKKELKV